MERHVRARLVVALVAVLVTAPGVATAQPSRPAAGINQEQGAPGSAGPGPGVVQRGGQPNPAEVRPGSKSVGTRRAELRQEPGVRPIPGS